MIPSRSPFLDGVRACAAQAVVIGHAIMFVYGGMAFKFQNVSVVLFFLLSGFLIGAVLLRQWQDDGALSDYLIDRATRIFPPYLAALVVTLALDWSMLAGGKPHPWLQHFTVKDWIGSALMLQQHPAGHAASKLFGLDWAFISTFGTARPFWTVAVEWWLYIAAGMFVLAKGRANLGSPIYLGMLLFAFMVPYFNAFSGNGEGLSILWGLGALAAVQAARPDGLAALARHCWMLTVVLLIAAIGRVVHVSYISNGFAWRTFQGYDFVFSLLVGGVLLVWFARAQRVAGPATWSGFPFVRFVAAFSYSLYLVHYPLMEWLRAYGFVPESDWQQVVFLVLVSNGVAIPFFWAFERNYRQLRSATRRLGRYARTEQPTAS